MSKEQSLPKSKQEQEESLEKKEVLENALDKKKTPEEIRQENIQRMTEKARAFIAEKKAKKREEELRQELYDKPDEDELKEKEELGLDKKDETMAENGSKKKKGFIESIKERLVLKKFRKAGIENPEKALEFYEYIIRKIRLDFNIKHKYHLDAIKNTLEVNDNPIEFYEKLNEIYKTSTIHNPGEDWGYGNLGFLLKDPEAMKKLDSFKFVVDSLRIRRELISSDDIVDFCKNEEFIAKLDIEKISRIKELIDLSGERASMRDMPKFLSIVEEDDFFQVLIELIKKRKKEGRSFYLDSLIDQADKLKAAGLLGKTLESKKINLEISDVDCQTEQARSDCVQKIEALRIEELLSDEEFRQFSDDFAIIFGKKFDLAEFYKLHNLYVYHKDYALAYFEALKNMGMLHGTESGDFDINEISDTIGQRKKRSTIPHDGFFILLDPRFQEKLEWFKGMKKDFKDEDVDSLAYAYLYKPELISAIETPEGKDLFNFFIERGIDPIGYSGYADFFSISGATSSLKRLDKFMIIGKDWAMSDVLKLLKEKEKMDGMLDFLEENDFKPLHNSYDKFTIGDIDLLAKLYEHRNHLNLELFKEYFNFYFKYDILDKIEKNPEKAGDLFSLAEDGFLSKERISSRNNLVGANLDSILRIPRERRPMCFELFERVDQSPSQEIQRLKNELIVQLSQTEDPQQDYEKIEEIFIKNNLPPVGKIFKVFSILHRPEVMDSVLERKFIGLSPCLLDASRRKRYALIYRDLLNIHIRSGNRDLKNYLEIFEQGQDIFDKIESQGAESLDGKEKKQAEMLLKKMKTLRENSQDGFRVRKENMSFEGNLEDVYQELKRSIGAAEGQTVSERISRMFLAPAGYASIGQVLEEMNKNKSIANARGFEVAELLRNGEFNLSDGDLIKAVGSKNLESILQSGAVAGEFLGGAASSDATPYDSDFLKVSNLETEADFTQNIKGYYGTQYGDLNIIVKNRGQFSETTKDNSASYDSSKLELFPSTNTGIDKHHGVRTGIPSSQIDLMIIDENNLADEKRKTDLFFKIAKNDFYIPVADTNGKLLFTPEMYAEYRKAFNGLEQFGGEALEFEPTESGGRNYPEVARMMQELPNDREKVEEINSKIRHLLKDVLEKNGITLKDEWDSSIIGAEILNTGSTARHTNAPQDYDFDLILRLDNADMPKVPQIVSELRSILQGEDGESHADNDGGYQLRSKGARGIDGNSLDIDIGFVKKSELVQFGSHDAVAEKLEWIKDNISEEAYEQALANIILAKKVLKEGKAYKKLDDGGIGGIGVENWILANGGNMQKAFESFDSAAHDQNGNIVPFEEFRQKYKIIDPGINLKFNSHDDFFGFLLKEDGYNAMVRTVGAYLGKE